MPLLLLGLAAFFFFSHNKKVAGVVGADAMVVPLAKAPPGVPLPSIEEGAFLALGI